jgi:uncharacterized protein YecE (DUF72 family)
MYKGKIHIGTSGFSYKHWKGRFYPKEVRAADYLAYYAAHFRATEINSSFYRLPSAETVAHWASIVPGDFIFCPKMSRYLTHMKKLRQPQEPLERFFSIFDPVCGRLGPVLIQLPPMLGFHADIVRNFYEVLQTIYAAYRFVVEVRHPSWLVPESFALMAGYGIGFVQSYSTGEFPYAREITARDVYIRLHGPGALYASSYSDAVLAGFAVRAKAWCDAGHHVWFFFNNDIHGYAPEDARRLQHLLGRNDTFN